MFYLLKYTFYFFDRILLSFVILFLFGVLTFLKDLIGFCFSWLWKFKPNESMMKIIDDDYGFMMKHIKSFFKGKASFLEFIAEIE